MTLPYQVVASDLDGTLLNPDHFVSSYSRHVLEALIAGGVHVVLATGRHHADVLETKRKLQLQGYLITSNGARVHDLQNRVIIKHNIEPSVAKAIALFAPDDPDVVTSIYRGDTWLMNRDAKDLSEFYEANRDKFYYQLFDPAKQEYDDVYKVYYTSDRRELLDALAKKITETYGDKVTATFSLPFCLEIMRCGVNKGRALQEVVSILLGNKEIADAVPIKSCIAFGDGLNDLEMLSIAEKGCLMGNAQKDLLARAPAHLETVGTNAEDGVAKHLVKVYALNVPAE